MPELPAKTKGNYRYLVGYMSPSGGFGHRLVSFSLPLTAEDYDLLTGQVQSLVPDAVVLGFSLYLPDRTELWADRPIYSSQLADAMGELRKLIKDQSDEIAELKSRVNDTESRLADLGG